MDSTLDILKELDIVSSKEKDLRDQYDRCVSYKLKYCVIASIITVPISIKMKRYSPFIVGALAGTAADAYDARIKCTPLRDQLDQLLLHKDELQDKLNKTHNAEEFRDI
ncbi:hypothetical protein WA158_003438 [Blastocystis sp. Blastoise]